MINTNNTQNDSQKRVVFSNYDDIKNPYYNGGGARSIHQIAKRLALKYRVTIITGKYPNSIDEIVDGVQYKRIGLAFLGPKLSQLFFQLLLPYYILTNKFDIWLESFTPPFSTACLQLFTSKPIIGTVNLLAAENKSREYNFPFIFFEKLGLKTYHYFIVLTDYLKQKISESNSKAEFAVIPHAFDLFYPIHKKRIAPTNMILFIGRLDVNQKGLDLLLDAFSIAADQITDTLYIVGSGTKQDEALVKKRIAELGLEKRTVLFGLADAQDKYRLYKSAKFVAMPSRYEGQGLVALETLAYGKPLLCFDIPHLSWISDNISVKTKSFSIDEYAKNIVKLSQNAKLRKQLALKSRLFAKTFNWDSFAIKYDEYIQRILKISI